MSYPWNELGIDETDDKKVIKKAYAKLIRQYRPEDEPEKFQEINQAYQFALQLLKNGQSVDTVLEPTVTADFTTSTQNVAAVEIEQVLDEQLDDMNLSNDIEQHETGGQEPLDEINEDDPEVILGNEILEQFHQMAFAEYRIKKQAKNWAFLEQYHEIQDLQLRDSLSKELFKRVVEYNRFQQQENGTLLLNQPMVKVMAEILGWESQWLEFEQTFSDAYVQHVFGLLEQTEINRKYAPFFTRIVAVYLEITAVRLSIEIFGLDDFGVAKEILLVSLFFGLNLASSLSKLHLPVIQYLFDIRLYDIYLNPPSVKQKIARAVVFHVSMLPVYINMLDDSQVSLWLQILGIVVVISNVICWVKNKQLFHDWISGTIMIK